MVVTETRWRAEGCTIRPGSLCDRTLRREQSGCASRVVQVDAACKRRGKNRKESVVVALADKCGCMTQGCGKPDRAVAGRAQAPGLPRVHLASQSPRRRELLRAAGIEHDAAAPG